MRLALLLAVLAAPVQAEADIFAQLTGAYGVPHDPAFTCEANPERVSFSADRSRATVSYDTAIIDYAGNPRSVGHYTVLGHDAGSVTMQLEDETRRTEGGALVVWIMRPTVGIDGFCWGRTDWPAGQCRSAAWRCPDPAAVS